MSKSIAVLGSDQVPLAYTVPVPGTLTPLTASAVFNGSGAGAFLPAVSFYDSDGNLITRATAPEVAAGGSAEVSWFPWVGGSGGGLTALNLPWGFLKATSQVISSSNSLTTIDLTLGNTNISGGTSGDPDITTGSVSGSGGLIINTPGQYWVNYSIFGSLSSAPGAGSVARFSSQTGISLNTVAGTNVCSFLALPGGLTWQAQTGVTTWRNVTAGPLGVGLQIGQNSGLSCTMTGVISVVKISTVTSGGFS